MAKEVFDFYVKRSKILDKVEAIIQEFRVTEDSEEFCEDYLLRINEVLIESNHSS